MTAGPVVDRTAFSWRFTTPLVLGSALNPINTSLIATALVPIADGIGVPVGQVTVLVSALYVATAIGQPTAGKLAEVFGPRRVFLAGVLSVLAGGVVGSAGSDLTTLVVARVLIGAGTSTAYPSAMVLVRQRADRAGLATPPGGVLGALVIAGGVTGALGLPIGGVLVDAWGWRATFLVNLPVALVTLAAAARWIPPDPRPDRHGGARALAARVDVAGIAGFAVTLTALLVFLLSLPRPDWLALGVAVAAGAGLVWWERRAGHPFLDVRLLVTDLALTRTYLRFALSTLCVYTVMYGLTQWLQAGHDLTARETGLLMLPMTLAGAVLAGPIARRNLVRGPLLVGGIACLGASAGTLLLTTTLSPGWAMAVTLAFGVALGTTMTSNQTALYQQAAAELIGTASGLLRTFGYLGSVASSALIALVFHTRIDDVGLHLIAWIMVAASVLGLVLLATDRTIMSTKDSTAT
jgi:MFS family permease